MIIEDSDSDSSSEESQHSGKFAESSITIQNSEDLDESSLKKVMALNTESSHTSSGLDSNYQLKKPVNSRYSSHNSKRQNQKKRSDNRVEYVSSPSREGESIHSSQNKKKFEDASNPDSSLMHIPSVKSGVPDKYNLTAQNRQVKGHK